MDRYVAVYNHDIKYDEMPVFKYNEQSRKFKAKDDLVYPDEYVLYDKDFRIIEIKDDGNYKEVNKLEFISIFELNISEDEVNVE